MTKLYGIIWLLLLSAITVAQAQKVIRGIVRNASDKQGLPGVTVLLKGTAIGTSTDMSGNFQLTILHDTITILFSEVGFISREKKFIISDTMLLTPVLLKEDCHIDLFYQKHVEVSLLSGLRYTPLGGRIKGVYPYLIHTGSLRTEFSYQTGNNNYQRNATLALDDVFINCSNDLSVTTDYQSVKLGGQAFSYVRYTVGATYTTRNVNNNFPFYLAVGKLSYVLDGISTDKTGIEVGIEHPLYIRGGPQLTVVGRVAWWQDYWQSRTGIEAEMRRFTAGINFNKLGQYAEINTRLGFKFERRFRAKKPRT